VIKKEPISRGERLEPISQEEKRLETLRQELEHMRKLNKELIEHVDKLAQLTRDFITTIRNEKGHTAIESQRLGAHYQRIAEVLGGIWKTRSDARYIR